MTAIDPARFPNVVAALREAGHDPATERIPVSPASHYVMGGITCDLRRAQHGRRASTPSGSAPAPGLHGANRLASNSLSECFVFGRRAALAGARRARARRRLPAPPDGDLAPPPSRATRAAMWRDAGLERDAAGLRRAARGRSTRSRASWRPRALAREESRGAHARADFPATRPRAGRPPQRHRRRRPRRARPSSGRERSALNVNSTERSFRTSREHASLPRRGRVNSGVQSGRPRQSRDQEVRPCTRSAARSTGSSRLRSSRTAHAGTGRPTTSACCAPARRACTASPRTATTSRARRGRCSTTSATYFPMSAQLHVYRVVDRYLSFAAEYLATRPTAAMELTGRRAECRATTRKGTPVPAHAAAPQRLLPVPPAPRRDRRGRARRVRRWPSDLTRCRSGRVLVCQRNALVCRRIMGSRGFVHSM